MTVYFVGQSVTDFDEELIVTNIMRDENSLGNTYWPTALNWALSGREGGVRKNLGQTVTGTVWISWRSSFATNSGGAEPTLGTTTPERGNITLYDVNNNPILYMIGNITVGNVEARVYLRNGSTVDLTIGTLGQANTGTGLNAYSIKLQPGIGFNFYVNGSLLYSYTGDVGNSLSTVNGLGAISVGNPDEDALPTFAEIIVADFDTRYTRIHAIALGTTSTNTASGTDPTIIDNYVDNYYKSSYITNHNLLFDTPGEKTIWNENDTITPMSGAFIDSIVISTFGQRTDTSPCPNIAPIVEIGGVEYTQASKALSATTALSHQWIYGANPATSTSWGSNIEGLRYGITCVA